MKKVTTFIVLLTVSTGMQAADWLGMSVSSGSSDDKIIAKSKERGDGIWVRSGCLDQFIPNQKPNEVPSARQKRDAAMIATAANSGKRRRVSTETCSLPKPDLGDQGQPAKKDENPRTLSRCSSSRPGSRCSLDAERVLSPLYMLVPLGQ